MHIAWIVLMVLAFACFLVSATGVNPPRFSLLAVGLAFWSLAELARGVAAAG